MYLESFQFIVSQHQRHPVSNIYGIGRNYRDHAKELNNPVPKEPLIFMKSTASLRRWNDPDAKTAYEGETFHHEIELVLFVKQSIDMSNWQKACDVGLGIDLTRREIQSQLKSQGHPWFLAKSFAGSAIVSDFMPLEDLEDEWARDLNFQLSVNHRLVQRGDVHEMIFSPNQILQYLNTIHPLMAGDVIFTGTPAGVGAVKHGDHLEFGFSHQGKLIAEKTYQMSL